MEKKCGGYRKVVVRRTMFNRVGLRLGSFTH